MTRFGSVRVFMLSNRCDGAGKLFAAIAQREGGAIDGDELELVVLVVVRDGEAGSDFEALAAHDEARLAIERGDRPRRRELRGENFENLTIAGRRRWLGGCRGNLVRSN